jgi:hypothetical protein
MLSSNLLYGIGIGAFSTGLYYILNYDNEIYINQNKNYKKDCGTMFVIILIVSVLILYLTGGSQNVVPVSNPIKNATANNSPPF